MSQRLQSSRFLNLSARKTVDAFQGWVLCLEMGDLSGELDNK